MSIPLFSTQIEKTTAEWDTENPVLGEDVIGIEIMSNGFNRFKRGNGVDPWKRLPYLDKIPPMNITAAMLDVYTKSETDVLLDGKFGGGDVIPIANGGTGATTANAAATNLYESGIWTPKLICEGTGAVNPTYTHSYNGTAGSPIGRYTRIGNLVYVQCYLPALISAAGTGLAAISGLPYAGSGNMDSTLVNRGYINALNGSVSTLNPVLKVSSGGTTVGYRIPDGSGGYNWKVNTSTSPKGSLIQFAGVYRIG